MVALTFALRAGSGHVLFYQVRLPTFIATVAATPLRGAFVNIRYSASARIDVQETSAHNAECFAFVPVEVCEGLAGCATRICPEIECYVGEERMLAYEFEVLR